MATINDKQIILHLLSNNGQYLNDSQVFRVYEYTNVVTNKIVYAIFYKVEHDDIYTSSFVKAPCLLFDIEQGGLLVEGKKIVDEYNNQNRFK